MRSAAGLVLAPKTFAPHVDGVAFVPSMALGVLAAAPILTVAVARLNGARGLPGRQSLKAAALFGIAAGILWNLGELQRSFLVTAFSSYGF